MEQPTEELVRALAAANGLEILRERLALVLQQYESFLRTVEEINSLSLPAETEPAFSFSLASPPAAAGVPGREK